MGRSNGTCRDRLQPFGYTYDEETGIFYFCAAKACRSLSLNLYADGKLSEVFEFPGEDRIGDVFCMGLLLPLWGPVYSYTYSADGKEFGDPYGTSVAGRKKWGDRKHGGAPMQTILLETGRKEEEAAEGEEAAEETPPALSYEESVIYRLHVRGFTQDRSSGVPEAHRGTFYGVIDKIPYLKELGITTLELMPAWEFDELSQGREEAEQEPLDAGLKWNVTPGYLTGVRTETGKEKQPASGKQPEGPVNFWGFSTAGNRFAVKAAYGGKEGLLALRKALHEQGMELVADLYFDGRESSAYVTEVARTWAVRYGLDGLHLIGSFPLKELLTDPYLKGKKLWCDSLSDCGRDLAELQGLKKASRSGMENRNTGKPSEEAVRYLAEYNTGFQNDMRCFLKGDGGFLMRAADRIGCNPFQRGQINYMANADGFTLWDTFSYNRKHNEENGEKNLDGTEENYSWNCGEEGPSRKKTVQSLRRKLYKNAVIMTVLSQGTPLIYAGDEMGHSKKGNNNTWCQDNRLEWLDWKDLQKNGDLFAFVKEMLRLRREHPVFCRSLPPRYTDYQSKGLPDVSLHGESAWKLETEEEGRQLGILYFGEYGIREDGTADESFYIGYNMHWQPHSFALPTLPKEAEWELLTDTSGDGPGGKARILHQKSVEIPERTVVILRGICRKKEKNGGSKNE